MSIIVFTDAQAGTGIVSVPMTVVQDDAVVTAEVVTTARVGEITSEADLLTTGTPLVVAEESAFKATFEVGMSEIAGKDISIELRGADRADDIGNPLRTDKTEAVQVVSLPDSWHRGEYISKWSRLCWEQQYYGLQPLGWWTNPRSFGIRQIAGFTLINDPTGADNDGDGLTDTVVGYDFPIGDSQVSLFVIPPNDRLFVLPPHKLDSVISNITIESIGVNLRKIPRYGSTAQFDTSWRKYQMINPEDDPYKWNYEGKYEFAPYPMIDGKQVPLVPHADYTAPEETTQGSDPSQLTYSPTTGIEIPKYSITQRKIIERDKRNEPSTIVIPFWHGDYLKFYYKIEPYSVVHEMDIYLGRNYIKKIVIDENYQHEGIITVDTFHGYYKKPLTFKINRYNCTTSSLGTKVRSWIDSLEVQTKKPQAFDNSYSLTVIKKSDDNSVQPTEPFAERQYRIKIAGLLENVYKPTQKEGAFTPDVSAGSDWITAIQNKKKVVRLGVTKYSNGLETNLGSFIVNPIATSGGDPNDMIDQGGVLKFVSYDSGEYTFDFDPFAGTTGLINDNEAGYYIFRLHCWSLGIEHGLITGENFAEIRINSEGKEYRYDSWDEEHPVRKFMNMSPVNPLDDSAATIISVTGNRYLNVVETNTVSNTTNVPTLSGNDVVAIGNPYWKVLYDTLPPPPSSDPRFHRGKYLLWPYFCMSFKAPDGTRFGWQKAIVCATVSMENPPYEQEGYSMAQMPTVLVNNMEICRFCEWSDHLEVHDFSTYQAALARYIEIKLEEQAYQVLLAEEQNTNNNGPMAQYYPPDPTLGLTPEQALLYEAHLSEVAAQCDADLRNRAKIFYGLKVYIDGETEPRTFPIHHAFGALEGYEGYETGIPFAYDRIVQPSGAVTFVGARTTEILGLIDKVTVIGEFGDPDVTTNTQDPPGLQPPKNYKIPHVITPLSPERTLEDSGENVIIEVQT